MRRRSPRIRIRSGAAGHYKGGFGFHPLLVSCGREVLAAILRPGNAGANNADDHLRAVRAGARAAPGAGAGGRRSSRARTRPAPATRWPTRAARRACASRFGYAIDERVRAAILALPERAWRPAINGDNQPREGAWVAELTDHVSLDAWPQGSTADRPPRAPASRRPALASPTSTGTAFSALSPTRTAPIWPRWRPATAPTRSSKTASASSRAPASRTCRSRRSTPNQAWLEAALCAHDLTVWTQLLLFDGEHAVCEPKRLRYRLLHVAGKLTRHARQLTLHLPADWPWAAAVAKAFKRLAALPT